MHHNEGNASSVIEILTSVLCTLESDFLPIFIRPRVDKQVRTLDLNCNVPNSIHLFINGLFLRL